MSHQVVLIRRIAGRDADAFESLCELYRKRLYCYLLRLLDNREQTEEALNDTFFAIWKGAAGYRETAAVSTWIITIARNQALTLLRKKKLALVDQVGEEALPRAGFNVEERLVSTDLVRRALPALSRAHREVLELTFYSGFSIQEIAEITGVPLNTVKTRAFHARAQLRRIILALSKRGTNVAP